MSSNSAMASLGGCGVTRLTSTASTRHSRNPGTISYRCSSPNSPQATSGWNCPHTKAVTAPAIMPTSAPAAVRRRQNRASSTIGPKAAPKPAQANATSARIELSWSSASTPATTETTSTPMRPAHSLARDPRCTPSPAITSSTRAELVTTSCEEMVDMIAASTAASSSPAISGWNRICARSRNTDSPLVVSVSCVSVCCWK